VIYKETYILGRLSTKQLEILFFSEHILKCFTDWPRIRVALDRLLEQQEHNKYDLFMA
jgi:hypothetical protein